MASLAMIRAQREVDRVVREAWGPEEPESPPPAPPIVHVVRHGKCRLTLTIGGTNYTVRPMPPHPGFTAIWCLRKLSHLGESAATYAVAVHREDPQPGCTCPDHELNKSLCKHIMALRALGLIPAAAPAVPVPTPRPTPTPAPVPTPVPAPAPVKKARKSKAKLGALPEGWSHGGAALPPGGNEICDECGCEFDPMLSGHHSLCGPCAKGGD
jgi:SWIM zinc finger